MSYPIKEGDSLYTALKTFRATHLQANMPNEVHYCTPRERSEAKRAHELAKSDLERLVCGAISNQLRFSLDSDTRTSIKEGMCSGILYVSCKRLNWRVQKLSEFISDQIRIQRIKRYGKPVADIWERHSSRPSSVENTQQLFRELYQLRLASGSGASSRAAASSTPTPQQPLSQVNRTTTARRRG